MRSSIKKGRSAIFKIRKPGSRGSSESWSAHAEASADKVDDEDHVCWPRASGQKDEQKASFGRTIRNPLPSNSVLVPPRSRSILNSATMKKFIAAFDGLQLNTATLQYAIHLSKQCNAHLVGVFLEDILRTSYGVAEMRNYAGNDFDHHLNELREKDSRTRQQSISIFEEACTRAQLGFSIHRDQNVAHQELLHESVYADLLIIGSGESLSRTRETSPPRFLRELLNEVQCPVLAVPPNYQPPQKIVLLYDGEPSSVFALRAFSYLFSSIKHLPTEVLSVKREDDSAQLPDNRLITEFVERHFPNPEYIVLRGSPEEEILTHLTFENEKALIVLGAYQRSRFSRLFRDSMADVLMQHTSLPLFIAHNKS